MAAGLDYRKPPGPWFGGKTDAAPYVWSALGDVPHFVDPFCGMLAVLLFRPHEPNRTYYSETVNDLDGLLINFWRAVQFSPQATAEAASWPVTEFDKHARGCRLLKWRESEAAARLAGDPDWHDPVMAGWWVWCQCVAIGGWGLGGPWWPDSEGKLRKRPRGWSEGAGAEGDGASGDRPHLSDGGRGVVAPQLREPGVCGNLPQLTNGMGVTAPQLREPGVSGNRPHLTGNGQGVTAPQLREPGVWGDTPNLANAGRGVNHPGLREPGVCGNLPQLTNGQGVNHPGLREPGVCGNLPHISDNGQGVNHPGLREPGMKCDRPHLSNNGQGVTAPQLREPGVWGGRPQLSDNGQGVTAPQLREPGVWGDTPHLSDNGKGVNHPALREPGLSVEEIVAEDYAQTGGFHPMTMPQLRRWFAYLAARLRHVRICNGDWTRVVTKGATHTIPVRQGHGPCGIFFDPPYGDVGRDSLYGKHESFDVATDVRAWCLEHGDKPSLRIVYAGYDVEGADLVAAGWREIEWFSGGYLKGGMGNLAKEGGHQQHSERLWASPHCLKPTEEKLLF